MRIRGKGITGEQLIDKIIWLLTVILIASFSMTASNLNGGKILILITMVVLALHAYKNSGKIYIHLSALQIHMLVFSLFCFLSALWATASSSAIQQGITVFEILVCVSVFYYAFRQRPEPARDFLKALMWAGYLLALYTLIFFGTDVIMEVLDSSGRLSNAFDNINIVGVSCAITIIIAVFFAKYEKITVSLVLTVPTLLILAASGTRKAFVLLIAGIVLVFSLEGILKGQVVDILKVMACLVVLCILFLGLSRLSIFSGMMKRMSGLVALYTGSGKVDNSALLRAKYVALGIEIFKGSPLFGIGMNNAHIIVQARYGHNHYLHNNYVEMLADGGAIGFLVYYSTYFNGVYSIIKKRLASDKYIQMAIILMLCMLVSDWGAVSYYSKITYFYFLFIFLALERGSGLMPDKKRKGIT